MLVKLTQLLTKLFFQTILTKEQFGLRIEPELARSRMNRSEVK